MRNRRTTFPDGPPIQPLVVRRLDEFLGEHEGAVHDVGHGVAPGRFGGKLFVAGALLRNEEPGLPPPLEEIK